MATLADELQNDFADSDDDQDNDNDADNPSTIDPELDQHHDEHMSDDEPTLVLLDEAEEEEDARLQADKSNSRDHKEMRGVASFMRSMEPILDVSRPPPPPPPDREFTVLNI